MTAAGGMLPCRSRASGKARLYLQPRDEEDLTIPAGSSPYHFELGTPPCTNWNAK